MKRFPRTIRNVGKSESVLDESRILVAFKKATNTNKVQQLAKELGLKLESGERAQEGRLRVEVNHTDKRYWLRSADNSHINDDEFAQIERKLGKTTDWIGPVYRMIDEARRIDLVGLIPNTLLIRKQLVKKLQEQIAEMNLKLNEPKSKYLSDHDYFNLPDPKKLNAFEAQEKLRSAAGDVSFESMPMIRDWCAVPNDPLFPQQWNMTQIQGPLAWDISTGSNTVVVAVLDSGTDLTHPDLQLAGPGIDLGDMISDGSPNNFGAKTGHGTCCSGIAAGTFNNAAGVTGVAGSCLILPLAISTFSDVEIANGVNWAVAQGADSISMSFGIAQSAIVDTELTNAFAANVVLCAATANANVNGIAYPASHPNVMAIGASDQVDNRKTPASPDGENWGSNFGAKMSVVAPGVLIPSTDIQGNGGFNPAAGAAGDYFMTFNGTSSATPHVAGLAALIRSQYAALTSVQIRNFIERSAQKTGVVGYAETAGRPNGTWNQEMGYGRINAFRSLDFSDVMIKDWAGDTGVEPSTSGNFWDFSDIVVRITDDNVFNPSNPTQSKNVERGQTNYIYVQVTNNGPRDARNVAVNIRVTPYVGLQFVYPNDWTAVDAMHVSPTSIVNNFASVPAGTTVIAKFSISSVQVEDLYGWQTNNPWHPCLLAQVTSDNDYAYATSDLSFGNIVVRKNNFAQRNLSVIDVFASASFSFPFVIGSKFSKARSIKLNLDRSGLPRNARVMLKLVGNTEAFPQVDFNPARDTDSCGNETIIFQNQTKVITRIGCCDVRITLEKNSKLEMLCRHKSKLNVRSIKGGELIVEDGDQLVKLNSDISTIDFDSQEGTIYALAVQIDFPGDIKRDDEYSLVVFQTNENNEILGGATAIYKVAR
jgi:subtilisin family serine protease